VMGIAGAAMSAGQLVGIPLATWLTLTIGWGPSNVSRGPRLGVVIPPSLPPGLAVLILPLGAAFLRNDPGDRGIGPYGAMPAARTSGSAPASATARVSLSEAMQVPALWLLVSGYFIWGYTTGGLIGTHLIPNAVEHGFTEMVAAQALGVMGATSIFGSISSGWVSDRFGRKGPLPRYSTLRGVSLFFLLSASDGASLDLFAFILGLNWFSTVPPTTTLTANIFGR